MHLTKSRQILLLLNPQDLLAFARTSKWLQSILGDPDCHFVWKAVRERIGYPAPREARYEYWWASLLFGRKICQVRVEASSLLLCAYYVRQICGSSPVKNIDWYLLKRVCTRCKDEQYVCVVLPDRTCLTKEVCFVIQSSRRSILRRTSWCLTWCCIHPVRGRPPLCTYYEVLT